METTTIEITKEQAKELDNALNGSYKEKVQALIDNYNNQNSQSIESYNPASQDSVERLEGRIKDLQTEITTLREELQR
jgi:polyhydroxyalkanoate synthesis regulator phasin